VDCAHQFDFLVLPGDNADSGLRSGARYHCPKQSNDRFWEGGSHS
jgi:hypothetical protein